MKRIYRMVQKGDRFVRRTRFLVSKLDLAVIAVAAILIGHIVLRCLISILK